MGKNFERLTWVPSAGPHSIGNATSLATLTMRGGRGLWVSARLSIHWCTLYYIQYLGSMGGGPHRDYPCGPRQNAWKRKRKPTYLP